MDRGMTRDRWLSLGLQEDALPVFEAGNLQTIEAAGSEVVGIPRHGDGHHLLGTGGGCRNRHHPVLVQPELTRRPGALYLLRPGTYSEPWTTPGIDQWTLPCRGLICLVRSLFALLA